MAYLADTDLELLLLFGDQRAAHICDTLNQIREIDLFQGEIDPAAFDFGHIQDFVDQA